MQDFLVRLTWSLPLREPSQVDSARLRALLIERSRGVTLGICKAVERAAIAAIRSGRERIELASFEDPEVWHGVAVFPSEQSILRLIGAVLLEANDEWQLQHRYMGVEAMGEMLSPPSTNKTLQLPSQAA